MNVATSPHCQAVDERFTIDRRLIREDRQQNHTQHTG